MWAPIIKAVVFGGWRELDVLGDKIDDAIIGAAGIIAARGGMVVIISAHPARGVDEPLQAAGEGRRCAWGKSHFVIQM